MSRAANIIREESPVRTIEATPNIEDKSPKSSMKKHSVAGSQHKSKKKKQEKSENISTISPSKISKGKDKKKKKKKESSEDDSHEMN
jgi:hypothetical protein